jgi:RNA polymerase sigma-70 factor, ECF subfamily
LPGGTLIGRMPAQSLRSDLEERLEAARRRWPEIEIDRERFVAHLAAVDAAHEAGDLHVEDLYLAFACAAGSDAAIAIFEKEHAIDIAAALRRIDLRGISHDDLRQGLRAKLFTAVGGPPKIAEYRGRGKLRNWVRVTMLRMRIDAERARKVEPAEAGGTEPELDRFVGEADPELGHLKAHYRQAFRQALAEAFGRLEPRQRTLLRQRHVEALSTGQLAALHDVHRATLKRWLAQAREQLLADTKTALARQIGRGTELDSVVRLIQSNFDVSVARMLGDDYA